MEEQHENENETEDEVLEDLDLGDDADAVLGGRFRSGDPCEGGE
jgi:hypothetical protein